MPSYNLTFHGRVQGVFYRDFVCKNADELNLTGWVKNELDGTVSAHVEGEEESIEEFVGRCWDGPPSAKVEDVKKERSEEEPGVEGFEVRY